MKRVTITRCGALLISILLLTACSNSSGSTSASAQNSIEGIGNSSESTGMPHVEVLYGEEDGITTVTPINVKDDTEAMDDAALISLFEKVYGNACAGAEWLLNCPITYDASTVLNGYADNVTYALVTGVDSMDTLKACLEFAFSDNLLKTYIYPTFFEGDNPKFMEKGSELYMNIQTGGAIQQNPDFQKSVVTDRNATSFIVEAPMHGPDNVTIATYAYKVIEQKGYWVIDKFYFFDIP